MKKQFFIWGKISVLIIVSLIIFLTGYLTGRWDNTGVVEETISKIKTNTANTVAELVNLENRELVLLEHPQLIPRIMKGGSFGNDKMSIIAAKNMFSRLPDAIEDIKNKTVIYEVYPDTWFVRMPIVNAVVVKTNAGLVVIDTGMSPGGPALYDAVRTVSDMPVHSIIYTHGHVDHSYGTWAFIEAGESPNIIAHENINDRFNRYLRLRGSIAKNMSQPLNQLPESSEDIIWPTRTFSDSLHLEIGGESFILKHHRAETDDHLYIWIPNRKILASADFYQGFLPNAGNGKRVQRYVGEWANALNEMARLNAEILLPGHGDLILGIRNIHENLSVLAEALSFIESQTIKGLNAGLRKDQIIESINLPKHLNKHPSLQTLYVSSKDIAKMVIKQYTGWWDDIPSNWTPSSMAMQSLMITNLAGGIDSLINASRTMIKKDIKMASHIADWAFFAYPENEEVQKLIIEVYSQRIIAPESTTQEMLAYLDHMALVRGMMKRELDIEIKK